eukprot:scaffold258672_cov24-Tisochrysis_lutea.AAC.1
MMVGGPRTAVLRGHNGAFIIEMLVYPHSLIWLEEQSEVSLSLRLREISDNVSTLLRDSSE